MKAQVPNLIKMRTERTVDAVNQKQKIEVPGKAQQAWQHLCREIRVNISGPSHRRVTFHLPDGSQESCSDSGLGDHEPVSGGTLISHPLPLVQPQDEFYEQASPDKRTEADGNSDPNS
eukprot:g40746.t1